MHLFSITTRRADGITERLGTISSLKTRSGLKLVEVTQTLPPGMSGGPILNDDGQVIGVKHKGGPTEGRNFAIAINELCDWHKELSKA
ncbi:trypsin-like peptidase domain-containing protein [Thalassospira lucentensis]|uniref:trypsin-like peptidase domain-containing protein n=1 Tax=Thalassospira lucentensis TaxID=168935 RepID=UPI00142DF7DD|nr:trypsin-like peptidase domain-containing protein [Thalassospira lucentensis]